MVAEHTRRLDTDDLDKRLAEAGIPLPSSTTCAIVLDHPQLSERDRWRQVGTAAGQIRAVLPPMTFRDVELPMGPVPALGEHTDTVLAELGLTDATIAGLRTGGAVG